MKAVGLEAGVDELKWKVVGVKKVGITKFNESDTYKLALNIVIAQFIVKKRLKMK